MLLYWSLLRQLSRNCLIYAVIVVQNSRPCMHEDAPSLNSSLKGVTVNKTKSRSELSVDKERARDVLGQLYAAYVEEQKLFALVKREVHAPQRVHFPPGVDAGSLKHGQWLFFAAMTDRREQSDRVYASHAKLAKQRPELYTPAVIGMKWEYIAAILKSEKVGSPNQSAKYWPRCAKTLFERLDGDPLNLYKLGGIDDILASKRGKGGYSLPGFGPKILSLLSLFYAELGLMQMPSDAFPADVHAQRFAICMNIVTSGGRVGSETVEKLLRPLFCGIALEEGWPILELAHAVWFLGNRLCTTCYRNGTSKILCPLYEECLGSPSTKKYYKKGIWQFDDPRHRKGGDRDFILPEDSPLFLRNAD